MINPSAPKPIDTKINPTVILAITPKMSDTRTAREFEMPIKMNLATKPIEVKKSSNITKKSKL